MKGRPINEAPRDGTIIIASIMNYSGVPETGHYGFERLVFTARTNDRTPSWYQVGFTDNFAVCYGDQPSSVLAWWPDGTPEDQMEKRARTNFKWVPSNGTSGGEFFEHWCANCLHDHDYQQDEHTGKPCDILGRTMAYGIGDAEYPEEWTREPDGEPKCTAFVRWVEPPLDEHGEPITPAPRCKNTRDLFNGDRP